jgi:hypothetical protein
MSRISGARGWVGSLRVLAHHEDFSEVGGGIGVITTNFPGASAYRS